VLQIAKQSPLHCSQEPPMLQIAKQSSLHFCKRASTDYKNK
jgi:hypothetical protein